MAAELNQVPEKNLTLNFDNPMMDYGPKSERMFNIAQAYQIDSQEMLIAASEELKVVKTFAKDIEAKEKEFIKPLNDLKTKWIAFFKPARERLAEAERQLKGGIDKYLNDQEQKRITAQAEADRLARLERQRLEAEAKRIADEAAAQDRKAREEQARIDAEARKAQQAGDTAKAAALQKQAQEQKAASDQAQLIAAQEELALQDQAMFVPTQIVSPEVKKVSGMSQTHTYGVELVDKMELIKAIASGQLPDVYVDVNMTLLNKQAKALKEQLNIPGVKVIKKSGISQRT